MTANSTTILVGNSTVNVSVNSTSFSGTSNNSTNLGGVSLSTLQTQITGNSATAYANAIANAASNAAGIYQTTAGLSANVLVLTANAATFLGNSSGTIANVASWISGNAAAAFANAIANAASNAAGIYQTTAGLSANIAAYLPTYSGIVNGSSYTTGGGYGSVSGGSTVNTTIIAVGNTTTNAYINSTSIYIGGAIIANSTGSNNAFNLSGVSLSTLQTQITGNSATAYANAIANAASNAAGIYQTTAGLSANVLTLTSNAAGFLGNSSGTIANVASWISGNSATAYTNATTFASNASNITSGTLPYSVLGANVVNTSATFTFTGLHTYSNGISFSNTITANGSNGSAGQVLTSSGATGNVYWSTASGGGGSVNTAAQYVWSNTHIFNANVTVNSATFSVSDGTSGPAATINTSIVAVGNSTIYTLVFNNNITSPSLKIGNSTINATALFITNAVAVSANGSNGSSGQVFTSNGTGVYWSTPTSSTSKPKALLDMYMIGAF